MRFIECGKLEMANGSGFELPYILRITNGICYGDLIISIFDTQNGKLNLPVEIKEVRGYFVCSGIGLTTLKGCPEYIDGFFNCSFNKLSSLEGCPKKVNGSFYCFNNNLKNITEEDIRKVCDVKGEIYL